MLVYGVTAKLYCGLRGLSQTGADPFFTSFPAMFLPISAPDERPLTVPDRAMQFQCLLSLHVLPSTPAPGELPLLLQGASSLGKLSLSIQAEVTGHAFGCPPPRTTFYYSSYHT